jgi:hypothetical protein
MTRFLLIIALILPIISNAQEWVKTYNGGGDWNDHALAITIDASNNVYITGYTYESGTTEQSFTTVSYSASGGQRWVQPFQGEGINPDAIGNAVTVDNTFYYVYATGWRKIDGNIDMFTVKFHPDGDTLWTREYDGPYGGSDKGEAIAVDGSGNVYVAGFSGDSLGDHIALIKYNSSGTQQWVGRYDASMLKGIAIDDVDNIYITGTVYTAPTHYDFVTIKYNPSGDTAWTRIYNSAGNNYDVPEAIAIDDNNDIYVAGRTSVQIDSISNVLVVKYNSLGTFQWQSEFDSPSQGEDRAVDVAASRFNGVYITGRSSGFGSSNDILLIRYNTDGDTVWVRRYDGPSNLNDFGTCLAMHRPIIGENICVGGYSMGVGTSYDYAVIKYSGVGTQQWVARYDGDGSGWDEISDISFDFNADIVVTGNSLGFSPTGSNYCTAKYLSTGPGVGENEDYEVSDYKSSIEVSPNPFSNITDIRWQPAPSSGARPGMIDNSPIEIKIYDIAGRVVKDFSGQLSVISDQSSVIWDGSDTNDKKLPSGVYIVKVSAGNNTATKQVLFIR